MQAMILAAGEGRRMRPLTLQTPKPLLQVAGQSLIEHQLQKLAAAGIAHCIINIAYLGHQIKAALGNGDAFGVTITYSEEPHPLETGGAINRALPLLADAPLLLINADVWLDYPLAQLLAKAPVIEDGHLVLVENPPHNPQGDFYLHQNGQVIQPPADVLQEAPEWNRRFTFSGLSLLHPRVVRDYPHRRDAFPLREALNYSISRGRMSGEAYRGMWRDIGTPERLHELESYLLQR